MGMIATWVMGGVLAATGAVTPVEPGPAHGSLIVLNKSDATAWVVDASSGARRLEVDTGAGPHEVAITPDGRTAIVADYGAQVGGNTLTVFDVVSGAVKKTIDLGRFSRPHGIECLDDGRRVAITSETTQRVVVVDIESGEVVTDAPTDQGSSHMLVLSPDETRAYASNIGPGSVSVVDLEKGEVVKIVRTGAGAEGLDVTPDGKELWVGNRAADTVTVMDTASLEVVATLPAGSFPIRVKITPDGERALVSAAMSGEVIVFDVAERKEVKRIKLARDRTVEDDEDAGRMFTGQGSNPMPIGILVQPDGKAAYIASTNANFVAVLDLATLEVVRRIDTGNQPDGLGWSAYEPAEAVR